MVDPADLKSADPKGSCRFESDPGHLINLNMNRVLRRLYSIKYKLSNVLMRLCISLISRHARNSYYIQYMKNEMEHVYPEMYSTLSKKRSELDERSLNLRIVADYVTSLLSIMDVLEDFNDISDDEDLYYKCLELFNKSIKFIPFGPLTFSDDEFLTFGPVLYNTRAYSVLKKTDIDGNTKFVYRNALHFQRTYIVGEREGSIYVSDICATSLVSGNILVMMPDKTFRFINSYDGAVIKNTKDFDRNRTFDIPVYQSNIDGIIMNMVKAEDFAEASKYYNLEFSSKDETNEILTKFAVANYDHPEFTRNLMKHLNFLADNLK